MLWIKACYLHLPQGPSKCSRCPTLSTPALSLPHRHPAQPCGPVDEFQELTKPPATRPHRPRTPLRLLSPCLAREPKDVRVRGRGARGEGEAETAGWDCNGQSAGGCLSQSSAFTGSAGIRLKGRELPLEQPPHLRQDRAAQTRPASAQKRTSTQNQGCCIPRTTGTCQSRVPRASRRANALQDGRSNLPQRARRRRPAHNRASEILPQ